MKKTLRVGTAVAALGFLSVPVSAEGLYGSIAGGISWPQDVDLSGAPSLGLIDGSRHIEPDIGLVILGALGYDFSNGFRAEGELGFRRSSLDSITVQFEGSGGVSGHLQAFSMMLNGWYDYHFMENTYVTLGGGVGGALVSLDADPVSVSFSDPTIDDCDFVFAYQLGAGVGRQLQNGVHLTLDYRFFGTADPDFSAQRPGFGSASVGGSYQDHSVLFGVKIPLSGNP